jgi:hypothetical protein
VLKEWEKRGMRRLPFIYGRYRKKRTLIENEKI